MSKLCVFICQFQPVMVKKDRDEDGRQKENSGKLETNGRGNNNVDQVGIVGSSSAAASSQASA